VEIKSVGWWWKSEKTRRAFTQAHCSQLLSIYLPLFYPAVVLELDLPAGGRNGALAEQLLSCVKRSPLVAQSGTWRKPNVHLNGQQRKPKNVETGEAEIWRQAQACLKPQACLKSQANILTATTYLSDFT